MFSLHAAPIAADIKSKAEASLRDETATRAIPKHDYAGGRAAGPAWDYHHYRLSFSTPPATGRGEDIFFLSRCISLRHTSWWRLKTCKGESARQCRTISMRDECFAIQCHYRRAFYRFNNTTGLHEHARAVKTPMPRDEIEASTYACDIGSSIGRLRIDDTETLYRIGQAAAMAMTVTSSFSTIRRRKCRIRSVISHDRDVGLCHQMPAWQPLLMPYRT